MRFLTRRQWAMLTIAIVAALIAFGTLHTIQSTSSDKQASQIESAASAISTSTPLSQADTGSAPSPSPTIGYGTPKAQPVVVEAPKEPVPDRVVLQFASDASPAEKQAYIESVGGTVDQQIDSINTVVVKLPKGKSAEPLPKSPKVAANEPDYYVTALDSMIAPPNDPRYGEQWALPTIGAPDAWSQLPANTPTVVVAVVDSGICPNHTDLAGRIVDGWDILDNDATPQDDYGHGCSVAGVIAANMNDGVGIAGVAPNAIIMPIRVLNASGSGTYSDVAAGIVYAADHGALVINLSLGGTMPSNTLENAVNYAVSKGVILVAAAGNSGAQGAMYPAAYPSVIAVGSIDPNLQHSSFSNYGPDIDIWAPGRDILTTKREGGYGFVSGTSFASPYVTGAVVLEMGIGRNVTLDGGVLSVRQSTVSEQPTPTSSTIPNTVEPSPAPVLPSPPPSEATPFQPTNPTLSQHHVSPSLGLKLDLPVGWVINEDVNVGFGYSFYSPNIQFDENGDPIDGALIVVERDNLSDIPQGQPVIDIKQGASLLAVDGETAYSTTIPGITTSRTDVEFIHGEYVYRFAFLAPSDDFGAFNNLFGQILSSVRFVPVTEELHVREIESTSSAQSFAALSLPFDIFNNWYIASGGGYSNGGFHTGYAQYALDFARGTTTAANSLTSSEIPLAPVNGEITHVQSNNHANGNRCIDVKVEARPNNRALFLELCHIEFETYFLDRTGRFLHPGHPLGQFATDGCGGACSMVHIHIAAYEGVCMNQASDCNPWSYPTQRIALPFDTPHLLTLSGHNFPSTSNHNGEGPFRSGLAPRCTDPSRAASILVAEDICGGSSGGTDSAPPSGSFTAPANGSTISSRSVSIAANASDNPGGSGVKEIRFSAKWNGNWYGIGTSGSFPYSINWDMCSSGVPNGDVELGMEVWDNANNKWIYSEHFTNPHITKSYDCNDNGGNPQSGTTWEVWGWQNKYLAGYDNAHEFWTWGSYPYVANNWGAGAPWGWGGNEFSMRLQGNVYFPGGHYDFYSDHDDGTKVWVDGNIIVDTWWDGHNGGSGGRDLPAGNHQVKIEYYENTGDAFLNVWWYGPGYPRPDIDPPDGHLTSPANLSASNGNTLTISADASDDSSGVNRVEFWAWYCDGTGCSWRLINTDYNPAFIFNWDWSAIPDTGVWLTLNTYDNTGKSRCGTCDSSKWIQIYHDRVNPSATITSPLDNSYLTTDSILIQVNASDAHSGVAKVQFFVGHNDAAAAVAQTAPEPPPPALPGQASSSDVTAQDYWHEIGWDENGADGWSYAWDASAIADQPGVSFFAYAYDKAWNYQGAVRWGDILDRTPPDSWVNDLGQYASTTSFTVSWQGEDTASGVASYDVQYQDNGGSWISWQNSVNTTSANFTGVLGHTYGFRSRARDLAGHVEDWPDSADTETTLVVAPSNDDFNTPVVISSTPFNVVVDTRAATQAVDDPDLTLCNRVAGETSIWYRFTPATAGALQVDTIGSDYDTMLAIWTGGRGNLTAVDCNDDIEDGDTNSQLTTILSAGTTYYIEVSEFVDYIDPEAASLPDSAEQQHKDVRAQFGGGFLHFHAAFTPYPTPTKVTLANPTNAWQTNVNTVGLSWTTAQNASTYQMQVSTSSGFAGTPLTYTTSALTYSVVLTSDGTYYWRVKGISDHNISGPWSDVRSLTVDTVLPAKPVLSSPADGASVRGTPAYSWAASAGASAYVFEYDNDAIDPPIYTSSETTALTITPPEQSPGTYVWHVRARDAAGNWSDWSDPRTITIMHLLPGRPLLVSPDNEWPTSDTTPDFRWAIVVNALTYRVEISSNANLSDPIQVYTSGPHGMTYTADPLDEGTYYWHVQGLNPADEPGPWSTPRTFTIYTSVPAVPGNLHATAQGQTSISLAWDNVVNETGYRVERSRDGSTWSLVGTPAMNSTILVDNNLECGTQYQYHIQATNPTGPSDFSSPVAISTQVCAAGPLLKKPLNGIVAVKTVSLTWAALKKAPQYEVQIDDNSDFSSPVLDKFIPKKASFKLPVLNFGTYYWRVRTQQLSGVWTGWSETRSLTFTALKAPKNRANAKNNKPSFSWVKVPGASSYHLQVARDPDFTDIVLDRGGLTKPSFKFLKTDTPLPSGVLYWRIQAVGSPLGNWTPTWSFTGP